MPTVRLTQRRVDALRPRRKVRDVRDAELKGYGVRVMPSGATRYFIHSQHRGKRVWKIIGDAAAITESEARTKARSMLAALRDGREPDAADPGDTLFETVAEEVFERYGRRWKPRTPGREPGLPPTADTALLRGQAHRRDNPGGRAGLVPRAPRNARRRQPLGADPLGHHAAGRGLGIPPGGQQPLRRHPPLPAGAGRALPDSRGVPPPRRSAGPARGQPPSARGRRASAAAHRVSQVGDPHPSNGAPTGRGGSICPTAKSAHARSGCARRRAMFSIVCPDPPDGSSRSPVGAPRGCGWIISGAGVREEAGLQDVRLHDTRHSYASVALLCGESVRTVGRLLGHEKAATTLKYAHLSDATVPRGSRDPVSRPVGEAGVKGRRVRLTDVGVGRLKPDTTEYAGLGQRGARPRRAGAPIRASQLRLARARRRQHDQDDRRPGRAHDRRGRPEGSPGAPPGNRPAQGGRRFRRSPVPRLRPGRVVAGVPPPLCPVVMQICQSCAQAAADPRLRPTPAGRHSADRRRTVVRRLQPHRSGRSQQGARDPRSDHERRPRPPAMPGSLPSRASRRTPARNSPGSSPPKRSRGFTASSIDWSGSGPPASNRPMSSDCSCSPVAGWARY